MIVVVQLGILLAIFAGLAIPLAVVAHAFSRNMKP